MKKSNKILLTLASISIPFITAATVISCSSNNDNKPSNPKIDDQKKPQDPKKKEEQEKKPEDPKK
ncbi:lipoprotein, partial [Mycoplasma sp. 2261]